MNIKGLDKAAVLAALYNESKPLGMGFIRFDPKPMTHEEAEATLKIGDDHGHDNLYFDYLNGRVMKVDLSGDELDPWGYDQDNGNGAAFSALQKAGLL